MSYLNYRYWLGFGVFFLLIGCCCATGNEENSAIQEEQSPPVFHPTHEPSKVNAPYSDIVQVDNLYFLAGQIGKDHTKGALVEGGIEAETRQCLENIKAVLAQHDMRMSNVVKALVILDDINDFAAFNEVYKTYLPQKPARTTFAAEALAAGAKIEIEVVAVND